MTKKKLLFPEIKLFSHEPYYDNRGFFYESYNKEVEDILASDFPQDNHSYSHKNVIRGMHYQWDMPMGKLVRAVHGEIIDYFVDIRKGSDTYGKCDFVSLGGENKASVWIPPGFAHGFEVVTDSAVVLYKCTATYNKSGESGINPFDEDINVPWRTNRSLAILSEKDINSKSFKEYSEDYKFEF